MTQGERVRKVRKNLGLTLDKFGEHIGIKKSALSSIENGKSNLTDANVKSICREFNINDVWLRTGDGEMHTKINDDDRYSLNLGKLSKTENEFIRNGVNYLAETAPEKLKIVEEFMKGWLGIE
ncbi:MAG: helix-turn-helix transcriptional regulator [Lachnospiraceae bacterium]|nr:helix-turn-helix transcriptional regulator [Lachnospiraceae bacterium]